MSPRSLVKLGGLVDTPGQPLRKPDMIEKLDLLSPTAIPNDLTVAQAQAPHGSPSGALLLMLTSRKPSHSTSYVNIKFVNSRNLRYRSKEKMDLIQSMLELEFLKIGDLVLGLDVYPRFALNTKHGEHGWVYLWLELDSDGSRVVYVGKAGGTLARRCMQHASGFAGGSPTGIKHAANISNGIKAGKRYEIWARKAGVISLFGEADISMCEVEERALIQKFRPIWNKEQHVTNMRR